jgi:thiamine monophosphate kinase
VGVAVDPDRVPVAGGATPRQAIGGGDDYELCFTAPDPGRVRAAFSEAGLREPVEIGSTVAVDRDQPLEGGWEHDLG